MVFFNQENIYSNTLGGDNIDFNDLADEYLNSANLIKNRIDELTLAIQNTENQEIVYELRTRISTLYEILNECSATAIF